MRTVERWVIGIVAALTCWASVASVAAQTEIGRTPHLGVEFSQGGQVVPLIPAETENGQQVYVLTLRPEPFDISLPNSAWAPGDSDRYVALSISADPAFLNHLHVGQGVYETNFLGAFRAMAFDPAELGGLLTAERPLPNGRPDFAHNSLGAHRFADAGDRQILRVTSIDDRTTLQPRLAQGAVFTFVFYLDRDLPVGARPALPNVERDIIRSEEIDVVRVVFE